MNGGRAGVMTGDGGRAALMERLSRAAHGPQRSRLLRGLAQPWQTASLRFLRAAGRAREVGARTFFGATMRVVLPEPVSTSIWRYGFVEEDVCFFLLAVLSRGGRFVDVGAHVGFFTLLGAYLAGERGRVLALEPTPNTHRLLLRNVAAYTQVTVCPYAAFSEDREIVFHDFGVEFSAFNSVLGFRDPGHREPQGKTDVVVQARRLDGLLRGQGWEGVDVIKIDAESSEGHILHGLEETIRLARPAVITEIGDYGIEGSLGSRQILAWFAERGYSAHEASAGAIVPHRARQRYEHGNLLFLTAEHRARLSAEVDPPPGDGAR